MSRFGGIASIGNLAERYLDAHTIRVEYEQQFGYQSDTPPPILIQHGIKRGVELLFAYLLWNRLDLRDIPPGATNYDNLLPPIAERIVETRSAQDFQ